ncbi:MAG: imidazole glycerol phosphate synthase subunit HisF [Bacteroidetes bacterium HGW-Bacteroidetes-8]|jgi:cyclase|nr:MAG: imidazole glycerol phosphate synthase subunit HisF [Bacteroidetes bacterium HGW-Bacteroidetes-8]
MVAKRIIPCLDVHEGKTVKGVNFINLKEVGDPVLMGRGYAQQGADELVYLDISATQEGRRTFLSLVKRVAKEINIPFTVGGGITELSQVSALLDAGADKISINSAAISNPALVDSIACRYGSQFVVVAIDARVEEGIWRVMSSGGQKRSNRELFEWADEVMSRGAGEILFTSMDHDGTKSGFAYQALSTLGSRLTIPVIASGGAGKMEHFAQLFKEGRADAALAASVFHNGEIGIPALKRFLLESGVVVRL